MEKIKKIVVKVLALLVIISVSATVIVGLAWVTRWLWVSMLGL